MAGSLRIEARATWAQSRVQLPWQWRIIERTLVIMLPGPYRVLGWAPMGGGMRRAGVILNHQIALDNRAASDSPRPYLRRLARSLGFAPRGTIAMMTAADIGRGGFATARRHELAVSAWCSAGCSNALRVADRATVPPSQLGTINIAVAINQALGVAALAEALQIAVEARVLAVQQAGVISRRSGLPATGTGTDCVVVAAPDLTTNFSPTRHGFAASRSPVSGAIEYCGKHTIAGELIGRVVLRSCAAALSRCRD